MSHEKEAIVCIVFGSQDEVIAGPQLVHLCCAIEWVVRDFAKRAYTARFYSYEDFGLVLETWERLPVDDLWEKTNDRRKLAIFEERFV